MNGFSVSKIFLKTERTKVRKNTNMEVGKLDRVKTELHVLNGNIF